MRDGRRGVSLLEVLSIVAIVGILAAILLPALARAREAANRASCASNLSQLGLALHMYADECGGKLPWSGGRGRADCLVDLYGQYVPEPRVFICPSDAQSYNRAEYPIRWAVLDASDSARTSYDYLGAYTAAPIVVPELPAPIPRMPIMWDLYGGPGAAPKQQPPEGEELEPGETLGDMGYLGGGYSAYSSNHMPSGGNVLWLDGSVTYVLAAAWAGPNLPNRPEGVEMTDPSEAPVSTGAEPAGANPERDTSPTVTF
jgi:prepilin-type processing-associated H-X9-DG protein